MKTKITNISKIYSWDTELNILDIKTNQEILIENNKIIDIKPVINDSVNSVIDAEGCIVTPGFIDSHTHPIFIGNRSHEFQMRLNGKSYKDISHKDKKHIISEWIAPISIVWGYVGVKIVGVGISKLLEKMEKE